MHAQSYLNENKVFILYNTLAGVGTAIRRYDTAVVRSRR